MGSSKNSLVARFAGFDAVRRAHFLARDMSAGAASTFGIVLVFEVATAIGMFLVLKQAAGYWGPSGFGEYVTARRSIGVLLLLVQCGSALGITRYVAKSNQQALGPSAESLWLGGLIVIATGSALFVTCLTLFPGVSAQLCFGSEELANLSIAMAFVLPWGAVHATIYGYYWGKRQVVAACLLQFVNLVLVPSAVLLIPGLTVASSIGVIGLGWLLVDLAFAADIVRRCVAARPQLGQVRQATGLLLQYGAPRLPGELLLGVLLALPQSLAAHYQGLDHSGYVGLGQSFLTLIGAPFALLGHLLLPTISCWDGTGQHERVARTIKRAAMASMAGSIVVWALLAANASAIIGGFFGHEYLEAANDVRIICFGAVGYCLYVVMRNVLDAMHIFPFNAKNLAISTGLMLAASWFFPISESFALSMWVLGLLSYFDAARLQRRPEAGRQQPQSAAAEAELHGGN